jgi:pyruvate dehydrogenase (quinone)
MSSKKSVAHAMWEMLRNVGVRRVYGIPGDAMNGILVALRDFPEIEFIHVRHEEAGVFAANAEAFITGRPAAVCGTSGPGATHLVNGLYDAYHERVPVFAIAGDTSPQYIGSDIVEEVNVMRAYIDCTHFTGRIEQPEQAWSVFRGAINTMINRQGPVLVAMSSEVGQAEWPADEPIPAALEVHEPVVSPSPHDLEDVVRLVSEAKKVMIFGGDGCRNAHEDVIALGKHLHAPIGYSWRGKSALGTDNPNDVGMSGLLGYGGCFKAMRSADLVIQIGSNWPFVPFYKESVKIVQADIRAEALGRHTPRLDKGVVSDAGEFARALMAAVPARTDTSFLDEMVHHHEKRVHSIQHYVEKGPEHHPIRPEYLTATIDRLADDDAVFTVDTGTPYIWAARYLSMRGNRRIFGSSTWASMANAMPNSIGIALSQPGRQVIAMCGDGGISMLFGDLMTIAERQLPVKLVVFHNSMLDFVDIEFQEAGLVPFGTTLWTPNFAEVAKAMGIGSVRIEDPKDVEQSIKEALAMPGPVLIDAVVDKHALALPPVITPKMAAKFGFSQVRQLLHGHAENVKDNITDNIGMVESL